MKLRILGSGASEGIPAFLCDCAVCEQARRRGGRDLRQNACAHLEGPDGEGLLFDMPPQIKMAWDASGLDHGKLSAVLVTHFHSDHTFGLRYLLDAVRANGYERAHHVELYLPADAMVDALRRHDPRREAPRDEFNEEFYSVKPVRANQEFSLGPFQITPLETNHLMLAGGGLEGETFGYLVRERSGRRFAYFVDAQLDMPEATYRALTREPLDCLVFECTFAKLDPPVRHSDLAGLIDVNRRVKPRLCIASHISHRNLGHAELEKALLPHGIQPAYDGMTVDID